jgi:hypothetical protein
MRALIMSGLLIVLVGCRRPEPAPYDAATLEAIKALKADDSPYRVIYYPAVDLTKKPGP